MMKDGDYQGSRNLYDIDAKEHVAAIMNAGNVFYLLFQKVNVLFNGDK